MPWLGLASLLLLAQADATPKALVYPDVLKNSGQPISPPFHCGEEEIQSAGLDCSKERPCSAYLELNGVEGAGDKVVVAGDFHTVKATLFSVVLESLDMGATWREPFERIRTATLDQVQFVDLAHGRVSGWNGNEVPRDPFFLATDDGGKTWMRRPIFDDQRAATIERFRFDSATTGTLLVTSGAEMRHQLYETMTGGGEWSLRHESDSPFPFPGERGTSAGGNWRLRTDSKANAYVVEKANGDSWAAVARFRVAAGQCEE